MALPKILTGDSEIVLLIGFQRAIEKAGITSSNPISDYEEYSNIPRAHCLDPLVSGDIPGEWLPE